MSALWPRQLIPDPPTPVGLEPRSRILVVKLAGLGDLLLATPALRALRARYPAGHIDLLVTRESAPLVRDSPVVDQIYTLDKYAFDTPAQIFRHFTRLTEVIRPLVALRRTRYDALLLLHHLTLPFGRSKYRALLGTIAPRLTVGLDNGYGRYLDLRVPDHGFGARHEAEYALDVAAALGAILPEGQRSLRLADLGWKDLTRSAGDVPLTVALHPGSGGYSLARRWPAERFAEVASALHVESGARVLLVGGAEEQSLHADVLAGLGEPTWAVSLAGTTDPRELARVLAECALFVGNDSLPMHLAVAAGVPVVSIFGPSNARAWGPYAPDAPGRAIVVRRELPCSPCFYRGHELGTPHGCPPRPCLTELPVAPVLAAARRLLRQAGAVFPPAG
jgi:ADP-heptose:LPS heptosyltransferase